MCLIKGLIFGIVCFVSTVSAEVSFNLSATTGDADFDLSLNSIKVENFL
jgi:hypothetical protein